jgi:hypothetical protein
MISRLVESFLEGEGINKFECNMDMDLMVKLNNLKLWFVSHPFSVLMV